MNAQDNLNNEMYRAIRKGDVAKFNAAVTGGADIHMKSGGIGTLEWATRHRQSDVAKALIKAGVDVDQTNAMGNTPLFYAIAFNSPKAAATLMANGANVNHVSHDGSTPLHCA